MESVIHQSYTDFNRVIKIFKKAKQKQNIRTKIPEKIYSLSLLQIIILIK